MPFALSAGQPRGRASSCRAQARGGRRLAASIAVDGRAALPSGGWVAAGCHLSSSNVPGWVVSQPWWLVSMVVAFRRRFESPRAYRPAPRKRGACAADERRRTHDATPAAPSTASPGAGLRELHPIPPPFPIRGRGRGVTSAAAGNGPPGTAARAYKRSTPTPERTPKHTGKAPRPKAPGNSPLTNRPPSWYSCPRGVASAAAASAALQHLQGSPGAAKARKVTSAFRAFILPPTAHQRDHRRIQCA